MEKCAWLLMCEWAGDNGGAKGVCQALAEGVFDDERLDMARWYVELFGGPGLEYDGRHSNLGRGE